MCKYYQHTSNISSCLFQYTKSLVQHVHSHSACRKKRRERSDERTRRPSVTCAVSVGSTLEVDYFLNNRGWICRDGTLTFSCRFSDFISVWTEGRYFIFNIQSFSVQKQFSIIVFFFPIRGK